MAGNFDDVHSTSLRSRRLSLDFTKLKRRISVGIHKPDTATYRTKIQKMKDDEKQDDDDDDVFSQSETRVASSLPRSRSLIRDHRVAQERDYFLNSRTTIHETMDDCYVTLRPGLNVTSVLPVSPDKKSGAKSKQNTTPRRNLIDRLKNAITANSGRSNDDDCYVTLQSNSVNLKLLDNCEEISQVTPITEQCPNDPFKINSEQCNTNDDCGVTNRTESEEFGGKENVTDESKTVVREKVCGAFKNSPHLHHSPLNILTSPIVQKLRGKFKSSPNKGRRSDVVHTRKLRSISRTETDGNLMIKAKEFASIAPKRNSRIASPEAMEATDSISPHATPKNLTKGVQGSLDRSRSRLAGELLTMDLILQSRVFLPEFRDFLSKERSDENLDFWLDCETYTTAKAEKRRKLARKIFNKYIDQASPKEINIDYQTKEAIRVAMSRPDERTFCVAQDQIYALMRDDSFPRFMMTLK